MADDVFAGMLLTGKLKAAHRAVLRARLARDLNGERLAQTEVARLAEALRNIGQGAPAGLRKARP